MKSVEELKTMIESVFDVTGEPIGTYDLNGMGWSNEDILEAERLGLIKVYYKHEKTGTVTYCTPEMAQRVARQEEKLRKVVSKIYEGDTIPTEWDPFAWDGGCGLFSITCDVVHLDTLNDIRSALKGLIDNDDIWMVSLGDHVSPNTGNGYIDICMYLSNR